MTNIAHHRMFRGNSKLLPGGFYTITTNQQHVVIQSDTCPACDRPIVALRRGRLRVYACSCGAGFQSDDVQHSEEVLVHGLGMVPYVVLDSKTMEVCAFVEHEIIR